MSAVSCSAFSRPDTIPSALPPQSAMALIVFCGGNAFYFHILDSASDV